MSNNKNRDIQRASDILHSVKLIRSFVVDVDFNSFYKSELIQSAVIHQFQIIGEASDKISVHTKTTFSNVPRRSIKSFRNILIHEYFKVDVGEVWASIENDLPALKEQMQDIYNELKNS